GTTRSIVLSHWLLALTTRPQYRSPQALMSRVSSFSVIIQPLTRTAFHRPSISAASKAGAATMPAARTAATTLALATDRIASSSEQDRHSGDSGFSAQRRRWRHLLPLAMSAGLVLAATLTGLAALGSAVGAPPLPPPLALLDQRLPGVFRLHMLATGLAMILLPCAILLRHKPRLHRPVGRAAAGCLLVGAAAALPSAFASEAVPAAKLGFLAQGGLCLALLILALVAIRRGERGRHAQLMQQAAATAFGAVVLRLLLVPAVLLELPF